MEDEQNITPLNPDKGPPAENAREETPARPQEPEPETKDMEIHHHPDLHHRPKPWKEYLLEGLMIFIAVTLGFFGENLREQIKDSRVIRRNMISMQSDLKADIAMYDSSIYINDRNCRMIDTLVGLLHEGRQTGKIYVLARKLTIGQGIFTPDAKTFELLKSTGGLRLIEDQQSLDSINAYYQLLKYFDYWTVLQRERINEVIKGNDRLFEGTIFFSLYKKIVDSGGQVWSITSDPPLLSKDPDLINSVIIHYQYLYGVLKILNRKAEEAESEATSLLDILRKEYE